MSAPAKSKKGFFFSAFFLEIFSGNFASVSLFFEVTMGLTLPSWWSAGLGGSIEKFIIDYKILRDSWSLPKLWGLCWAPFGLALVLAGAGVTTGISDQINNIYIKYFTRSKYLNHCRDAHLCPAVCLIHNLRIEGDLSNIFKYLNGFCLRRSLWLKNLRDLEIFCFL